MRVYRAYLKVLKACKVPIIMYTVFLIFFGGFNLESNDGTLELRRKGREFMFIIMTIVF